MDKVLNVLIHLTSPNRRRAAKAVYPRPEREPYEQFEDYLERLKENRTARKAFVGPHFKGDVQAIQCSEGTLGVVLNDGTVYMYPLSTVARCKAWKADAVVVPPVASDPDADIPF